VVAFGFTALVSFGPDICTNQPQILLRRVFRKIAQILVEYSATGETEAETDEDKIGRQLHNISALFWSRYARSSANRKLEQSRFLAGNRLCLSLPGHFLSISA
jgi:hypothetical protein